MTEPEDGNDWKEPWRNLAKLLNIVIGRAVGVLAIAGVAEGLELGIESFSHKPLVGTMEGVAVSLSDIIHYFDLVIFAVFLCLALVEIVRWALEWPEESRRTIPAPIDADIVEFFERGGPGWRVRINDVPRGFVERRN